LSHKLHEIVRPEYPGDVLVDSQVGGLFNDQQVDPERFGGKLVFIVELEGVFILDKFQLEGLEKGGVPGALCAPVIFSGRRRGSEALGSCLLTRSCFIPL
jgi:hypothetical protein